MTHVKNQVPRTLSPVIAMGRRSGHGRASRETDWRPATVTGGLPLHLGRRSTGGDSIWVWKWGIPWVYLTSNHCSSGKIIINYLYSSLILISCNSPMISDKLANFMLGFSWFLLVSRFASVPAVHILDMEWPDLRGMTDAAHFYTVCSLFSAAEEMGTWWDLGIGQWGQWAHKMPI